MEIILSVLQILGIILLVLLTVVVLALLIVLFLPFRYRIFGEIYDKKLAGGNFSWLFHLVRGKFTYKDELFYAEVGILWKKIKYSKNLNETNPESDKKADTKKESDREFNQKSNRNLSPETEQESGQASGTEEAKNEKSDTSMDGNRGLKHLFHTIKEKILFIRKKATQIKKLIQDSKNQRAVKHLKDELFYLIKLLLPKKSRLKASFSTGSPDTTGQLFGIVCCFPIIYKDKWMLTPDFQAENAYFEGDFKGKGRIYVFQLVGILIRVIMDKNCRRLFYILKRLGG